MIPNLVGGWTNPSDKYWSNWSISPERGENKKHVKPPPRNGLPPMYDIPDVDTHVIGYREQPHTFAAAFSCYVQVQSICECFQQPSTTTNIAGRKQINHDLEVGKTIMFLRNKALDVHFQPTIMIGFLVGNIRKNTCNHLVVMKPRGVSWFHHFWAPDFM